jgi:lipopolysaccharide/colanic/teichoic acid biosynthesis glycosyltransferase
MRLGARHATGTTLTLPTTVPRLSPLGRVALRIDPTGETQPLGQGQLREQVRHALGSRWVERLVLEGRPPAWMVEELVALARESGRALLVPAGLGSLPPCRAGETWVREPQGWVIRPPAPSRARSVGKRAVDMVGALCLLVLLGPLMLGLAIAVRLTSPGPTLYRWLVLGRNGRPLTSYKFRTMVDGAELMKDQLLNHNQMTGPVFKIVDDPRVTPLGRWLRRYSLDELPQLWSVLKGDLSLVGPRPPARSEYERYELWQMRKLVVKPGLTCTWQVSGRNRISDFADWARLDLEYIDRWSPGLELRILARTALAVVRGTGC